MRNGEKKTLTTKLISENRKARHDYQLSDNTEAGVSLQGWEVKSLREGGVTLRDSYIREFNGELLLVGCHITPYKHGRIEEMNEVRDRKLLLSRREIDRLIEQSVQKGLTLVPLKFYFKGAKIKLELALGKGKKLYDKREDLKKKEASRAIDRELSRRR